MENKEVTKNYTQGFTLIELILVVAILGLLATIALPGAIKFRDRAKSVRCMEEVRSLEKEINAYSTEKGGVYPSTLADINRDTLLDPWGHPYVYYNIVEHGAAGAYKDDFGRANADFDIYSLGPDNDTTKTLQNVPVDPASADDIVRLGDGGFVGLGENF